MEFWILIGAPGRVPNAVKGITIRNTDANLGTLNLAEF